MGEPTCMDALSNAYRMAQGSMIGLRYCMNAGGGGQPMPPDIVLDIRHFVYARYFFSFVKFLDIEGMTVGMRFRPETLHRLKRSQYANMVLSERLVSLVGASREEPLIGDKAGRIRIEPFDFLPSRDPDVLDIPMAQHPLMYARGLWNQPTHPPHSRPTILFIGNSDAEAYSRITREGLFDVVGRPRLQEVLKADGCVRMVTDECELASMEAGRVIVADTSTCCIPMESFRQTLSTFGFFLCAPGAVMPLCHNLIEAMSVGTIPLIQRSYAELLNPALEHGRNAIIFEGESDVTDRVREISRMPSTEIAAMKQRVLDYYDGNLTPRAVVGKVLRKGLKTIRMLAGEKSLELLRGGSAAAGR